MTARPSSDGQTSSTAPDLFAGAAPRLFTIDPTRAFLPDLAKGLMQALEGSPFGLADTVIYLPTRRAARGLTEAFLELASGAMLLPQIRTLGDVDEDSLASAAVDLASESLDLAPAISGSARLITMARFVAAREASFRGQENWPAAIAIAQELCSILDSFYTEEVGFDGLEGLVPNEFAAHWQDSIQFLKIVTDVWPNHLSETGRLDPADRRVRLIRLQDEAWKAAPPDHPVVIAGTTASVPAVRDLIHTVARLPRGIVVLPGLDLSMDAASWETIDDPHPQAGLKTLIQSAGVAPSNVQQWPGASLAPTADDMSTSAAENHRQGLLSLALLPARVTDDWLARIAELTQRDEGLQKATQGFAFAELETDETEARAIAIAMRMALEEPGKTAMLVSPDRNLARRVALKMRRWNVVVDDSAGVPFGNTPCGIFLRLVAQWMDAPAEPVALLALVDHPLCGLGLGHKARREALDALDEGLRGLAPRAASDAGSALASVRDKLARARKRSLADAAVPALNALEGALIGFSDANAQSTLAPATTFENWLARFIACAEALAATDAASGKELLWRGDDGKAGADVLADLALQARDLDRFGQGSFADVMVQLTSATSVRRRSNAHPRLSILGPLEARLQSADLVILAGLNEGVWPADSSGDSFLSRPMRARLGLPSPERRIGLAAHDFAQLASQRQVLLTRAKESGGSPAKASRWLVRLRNILKGAGIEEAVDQSHVYSRFAACLDAPSFVQPITRPAPTPPVEARPRELYVTRVETLIRDPYAIYAQCVLGLVKHDDPGAEFSTREMGNIFHKVFERAAQASLAGSDALAALYELYTEEAANAGMGLADEVMWREAAEKSLAWFAQFQQDRQAQFKPIVLEQTGEALLPGLDPPFVLKGRVDRIDQGTDGLLYIIDYKLGTIVSEKQIKTFSPQLPLTGVIAQAGGFDGVEGRIGGYEYIRILQDETKKDRIGAMGDEARELVAEAAANLKALIEGFDDPQTPYLPQPRPQFEDQYGNYDQLSRRREWGESEGESGE